jgi:hypothetical protein
MNSESKLVVELWDYFRDMLPAGKRVAAAAHILRLFEEYGVDVDHDDLEGECEYLDEAIDHFDDEDEDDDLDYNDEYDRD